MRLLLIASVLLTVLLACGDPQTNPDTSSLNPTGSPTEAAMNIDEGKAHYTRVLAEIRSALRCQDQSLTWRVSDPENVEGVESDEAGNYTAYLYRSPLYVAETACVGEDFEAAVKEVSAILEENGGVADDVTLGPDADFSEGGEVKWRDRYDGTWTLSSEKATVLSVTSGPLPRA